MQHGVVIIGGGWAGIAAGVELAAHGVPVQLVESARVAGGRARTVQTRDLTVDNGQHLLIGAYSATLALLIRLGIAEHDVLLRMPLTLDVRGPSSAPLHLAAPRLPAPLHLLVALLGARGIGWGDKLRAVKGLPRLMGWPGGDDISVSQLLADFHQPSVLVEAVWEPLCIAALNVAPDQASARVFTRVLHDSFATTRAASDLLIPRRHLGDMIPQPGVRYIEKRGGEIRLGERALSIEARAMDRLTVYTDRDALDARDVIVATAPVAAGRLLSEFPETAASLDRLNALGDEPIVTVYLQYPPRTRLQTPMIGLRDTLAQWIFDRRVAGQPGLFAVVISARGPHMDMNNDQLGRTVVGELARLFPEFSAPQSVRVIREKRATFRCLPDSDARRPANRTAQPGLWLAGDYTDTGLPATLEGAVRSGLECAHAILNRRNIEIKAC